MTPTLADLIPVVLDSLPPALVSGTSRQQALEAARELLPIARGDLEVRLGNDDPIDVLQCLNDLPGDFARLEAFASGARAVSGHDAKTSAGWLALARIACDLRSDAVPAVPALDEIWLESDAGARGAVPSLFLSFQRGLGAQPQFEICERVLNRAWEPAQARPASEHIRLCIEACPDAARVSHIGIMPGRAGGIVRVNVKGLNTGALGPYLERVGWGGQRDVMMALWADARARVDTVTLCLDVSAEMHPGAGLECALPRASADPARHDAWLAWLVQENVCAPEKRAALEQWEGSITPVTHANWSAPLVVESLLAPAHQLAVIHRTLSHIKLVYHPGRPLQAKAYLWFERRFGHPVPAVVTPAQMGRANPASHP